MFRMRRSRASETGRGLGLPQSVGRRCSAATPLPPRCHSAATPLPENQVGRGPGGEGKWERAAGAATGPGALWRVIRFRDLEPTYVRIGQIASHTGYYE